MIQMENTTANAYPRLAIQSDVKGYHIGVGGSGAGAGYANNLYFYDNNEAAVRMVIDTDGNVGIGTSSPDLTGFGYTALTVVGGTIPGYAGVLELGSPTTNANGQNLGIIAFMDGSTRNAQIDVQRATSTSTANMSFYTNGGSGIAERMRINSNGTIGVEGQNNNVNGMAALISRLGSNCDNTSSFAFIAETGGNNRCFIHGNGNIVNTNDSYGALSDERLKENIIDATPKLHDLMKVKVRNFNLKGDKTKQIGVVAQELEEVFPNMIDETKGLNPDDETLYKSVKYSVFVPMLIKAIQELKANNDSLKARIEILEDK